MAIRTAIGAGRVRIVRQFLTESLLLALLGGAFGLLVAHLGVSLLLASIPEIVGGPRLEDVVIDGRILTYLLSLSVMTALLCGVIPGLQASRTDLRAAVSEGGQRSGSGSSHRWVRESLVVGEMTLAVMLVIAAGLTIKSFWRLLQVDSGWKATNVLTFQVYPPPEQYAEPQRRMSFFNEVTQRIESLPGVESVGAMHITSIGRRDWKGHLDIEDRPAPDHETKPMVFWRVVSTGYFPTLGVSLLHGRTFEVFDRLDTEPVCVINQTMAERFWPDEDPVGKRIVTSLDFSRGSDTWVTVVGVVGDVKFLGLTEETEPMIYRPYSQFPGIFETPYLYVRSTSEPEALISAIRSEIGQVDSSVPAYNELAMDELLGYFTVLPRLIMRALLMFGGLALILGAIGTYGVISYMVSQRTHEIGIRMALGAQARDVLKLVVRKGIILGLIGVIIGLLLAVALSRTLRASFSASVPPIL